MPNNTKHEKLDVSQYNWLECYIDDLFANQDMTTRSREAISSLFGIQNMRCILGEIINGVMRPNASGQIAESCWKQLSEHYQHIELDAFVIMPNHVHGIITLLDVGAGLRPALAELKPKNHGLPEIIRAFKSFSSRAINEIQNTRGAETWQRNYYDHIIRNEKALNLIRLYVKTNPLLWNLDPDNPMISPAKTDLDQILLKDYGFDKDALEFVRNYLEVRQIRRQGGS